MDSLFDKVASEFKHSEDNFRTAVEAHSEELSFKSWEILKKYDALYSSLSERERGTSRDQSTSKEGQGEGEEEAEQASLPAESSDSDEKGVRGRGGLSAAALVGEGKPKAVSKGAGRSVVVPGAGRAAVQGGRREDRLVASKAEGAGPARGNDAPRHSRAEKPSPLLEDIIPKKPSSARSEEDQELRGAALSTIKADAKAPAPFASAGKRERASVGTVSGANTVTRRATTTSLVVGELKGSPVLVRSNDPSDRIRGGRTRAETASLRLAERGSALDKAASPKLTRRATYAPGLGGPFQEDKLEHAPINSVAVARARTMEEKAGAWGLEEGTTRGTVRENGRVRYSNGARGPLVFGCISHNMQPSHVTQISQSRHCENSSRGTVTVCRCRSLS